MEEMENFTVDTFWFSFKRTLTSQCPKDEREDTLSTPLRADTIPSIEAVRFCSTTLADTCGHSHLMVSCLP